MKKATFGERFLAWVIDQLVVVIDAYLLGAILGFVVALIGRGTGGLSEPWAGLLGVGTGLLFLILVVLLPFLYFGYFWSRRGKTIGMGIMRIKAMKSNGQRMSFWIAALRGTIGYYISGVVFGLGYLWILFDPQQEAWHDKIFRTTVLKD